MTARLLLGILLAVAVALRLLQRVLARRKARREAEARRGFTCPTCGEPRLVITAALALPGDTSAGVIDLEALSCRRCAFRGVAVRTDRPASHLGYPVSPTAWGRLASAIDRCPAPADRACACAAHARYGAQRDGLWIGLEEVAPDQGKRFVIT